MRIRELLLKNFGKFTDREIIVSEGIHILYGENESGKSTVRQYSRGSPYHSYRSALTLPHRLSSPGISAAAYGCAQERYSNIQAPEEDAHGNIIEIVDKTYPAYDFGKLKEQNREKTYSLTADGMNFI